MCYHLTGFIEIQCIFSSFSCVYISHLACLWRSFSISKFFRKTQTHTLAIIHFCSLKYVRFTMEFDLHKRRSHILDQYTPLFVRETNNQTGIKNTRWNKLFSDKNCAHSVKRRWLQGIPFGRSETICHILTWWFAWY